MLGTCGTGGMGGMGFGVYYAVALLLLALGMGCKVCAKSEKVECSCGKKITMVVGWFIMIVSVLSIACLGWRCISNCGSKKTCPLTGQEMTHESMPAEVLPETK